MAVSAASRVPTWEEAVAAATKWTQEDNSNFSVERRDEQLRRVYLCGPNCCFYLELPDDGEEKLVI